MKKKVVNWADSVVELRGRRISRVMLDLGMLGLISILRMSLVGLNNGTIELAGWSFLLSSGIEE